TAASSSTDSGTETGSSFLPVSSMAVSPCLPSVTRAPGLASWARPRASSSRRSPGCRSTPGPAAPPAPAAGPASPAPPPGPARRAPELRPGSAAGVAGDAGRTRIGPGARAQLIGVPAVVRKRQLPGLLTGGAQRLAVDAQDRALVLAEAAHV